MLFSKETIEELHRVFQFPDEIPSHLLFEALTHPSYKTIDHDSIDYEQLETIGDAVLDLVVVTWLYRKGAKNPLQLTIARSNVVDNKNLSKLGKNLQISEYLRTAPGHTIQSKDIADGFEAITGAVFIAFGFEKCYNWLTALLHDTLINSLLDIKEKPIKWGHSHQNPINLLQEFFQKRHIRVPTPKLVQVEGQDHEKQFTVEYNVTFKGLNYTSVGKAKQKKLAKKIAAQNLCYQLGILSEKNS